MRLLNYTKGGKPFWNMLTVASIRRVWQGAGGGALVVSKVGRSGWGGVTGA